MTTVQWKRYQDLERFLNVTGKSGYVNTKVVIAEMAKLLKLPKNTIYEVPTFS